MKTLHEARESVADFYKSNAIAIHEENLYASHVTQEQKDTLLEQGRAYAESVRRGNQDNCFAVWQRIHEAMTGECVAFLPH